MWGFKKEIWSADSEKNEWNFLIGTKILTNQDPGKMFTSIGKFLSGLKSKIAFSSFTLKDYVELLYIKSLFSGTYCKKEYLNNE